MGRRSTPSDQVSKISHNKGVETHKWEIYGKDVWWL